MAKQNQAQLDIESAKATSAHIIVVAEAAAAHIVAEAEVAAKRMIAESEAAAKRVVAEAAEQAIKVVANSAAERAELHDKTSKEDHDLLVELKTKVDRISVDIKEIKDEKDKRVDNHEKRITALETSPRITALETSKGTTNLLVTLAGIVLLFLVGLITKHMFF